MTKPLLMQGFLGADDGIRTRDPHLGNGPGSCRPVLSRSFAKVTPLRESRYRTPADLIAIG